MQQNLETYNRYNARKKFVKTGWRLIDDNGAIYMFSNIEELTLYFLNKLNVEYWVEGKSNIFIMDRTHLADWALLNLEESAYTVLHLHNAHIGNAQDPKHAILNNFYEFSLTNGNGYDAIVSATEKQTKDIKERFSPTSQLYTIPVGINPEINLQEKKIKMSERKNHSILMTCRIAPEKGIDKVVEAVGIAKQKIPDITLDVYGYIDHRNQDEAKKSIDRAIKKYDLSDSVHLHDYLGEQEVAIVQKEHQVYALMSIMEGFNLALMEAQSHGMVTVTNDVNYGPNDLVINQENGYIVGFDGIDEMAEKFIELFTNEDLLQKMSERAYDLSNRFSENTVWKSWENLISDATTKKNDKVDAIHKGLGNQMLEL